MKAIVMRAFGGPDVLQLEEVPTPEPGPGEVLVEVHAVSINRTLDAIVRAGEYARRPALPHVLGVDPSGVIAKVGPGVTDRKVGDRVVTRVHLAVAGQPFRLLGVDTWGGYAEFVKLPAGNTTVIPDALDFPLATVVSRHGPVAFANLRDRAKLAAGEWVLVMGASGGLGNAGIHAAKFLGAKVIAAAGTDERVAAGLSLGADAGINYRTQDLTAEALRMTEGRGVDIVFENVGAPDTFPKAFAALGRGGRLVTAGGHGGGTVPLDVKKLYLNGITIVGSVAETQADLVLVLDAASRGQFRVLIDRILPLAEAARAHELVESRAQTGKVLLDPKK
jgi:NADPH:quinone reductase